MPEGDRFGDLTLICAVMLQDPLRRGAKEAVELLRGAGVQVVMITGDNKDTARVMDLVMSGVTFFPERQDGIVVGTIAGG